MKFLLLTMGAFTAIGLAAPAPGLDNLESTIITRKYLVGTSNTGIDIFLRGKTKNSRPDHSNMNGASFTAVIGLGKTRVNVGDLVGSALYQSIWRALDSVCPAGSQRCKKDDNSRPILAKFDVHYIEDMILLRGPLEVIVEQSLYGTNDALRKLMIGTIAGAVQKASEDQKNCYDTAYGRSDTHPIRMCNIGDLYSVNIRDQEPHMYVRVKAPGKGGKFDCQAVVEATGKYVDGLLPEYQQALGGETARDVICSDVFVHRL